MFNGRRQPSCDGTSRMTRECQVRICERLGVKFPGPTRQKRAKRLRLPRVRSSKESSHNQRDAACSLRAKRRHMQCSKLLMMFQPRPPVRAGLAGAALFGSSTILGSRMVKVDPRPGSLSTVISPPII